MSIDELTELATGDQPGRPRPTMIALLALASLAVAIGLLLLTQRDGRALSELRIREANVDVRSSSSDFRQGIEGEPLEPNDAVRTDITGQAQIDFFDESLTRLDSDTTLVLRGLKDATPGGVLLTLEAGRSWNRVEPAESSEDRYEVRGVTGVASALGTTFVSDCRQAPTCYYLGVEGETEVTSGEDQLVIGPEECARAEEGLLRNCTDHEFDALMDDWVDENVAFDGGQIIDTDFDPGFTVAVAVTVADLQATVEHHPTAPGDAETTDALAVADAAATAHEDSRTADSLADEVALAAAAHGLAFALAVAGTTHAEPLAGSLTRGFAEKPPGYPAAAILSGILSSR